MPVSLSVHTPRSSGPRWARESVMRKAVCCASAVPRLARRSKKPAIPHISGGSHQAAIDLEMHLDDALLAEPRFGAAAGGGAHLVAQSRFDRQALHRLGQAEGFTGRHDEALGTVLDHLAAAGDVGRDDRPGAGG